MFCTKCGHKNKKNTNFCSKCGSKLNIIIEHDLPPKKEVKKSMSLEKIFQVISIPLGVVLFAIARISLKTLFKYWTNNS